jgi:origin recognition complex subunit 3
MKLSWIISFDMFKHQTIFELTFFCRYSLAQEHGDLINLHDWFQSFRTIVLQNKNKRKQKSKNTPLSKKRKEMNGSGDQNEASVQYPLYFSFHNNMISWGINASSALLQPQWLQCILLHLSQSLTLVCHRARFCRGVTELQITGLVRMPSKRRPDFVQRIAFGIWIQNSLVYFPPLIY